MYVTHPEDSIRVMVDKSNQVFMNLTMPEFLEAWKVAQDKTNYEFRKEYVKIDPEANEHDPIKVEYAYPLKTSGKYGLKVAQTGYNLEDLMKSFVGNFMVAIAHPFHKNLETSLQNIVSREFQSY